MALFGRKQVRIKTPYFQTGCLHWGEWSCAFQYYFQPGKKKDKYDPTDNWVGIFNKLSCDLHSAGSQPLDSKTNRKRVRGLRLGENLAWKFSWNTHLPLCLQALPVLSRALFSQRIQPTLAQAVPPACAHRGEGQPRTLVAMPGTGALLPMGSCIQCPTQEAGWEERICAAW